MHVSLISPGFVETEMTARRKVPKIPPGQVAEAVLKLLERPRAEVVVPSYYRMLIALERIFPGFGDFLVRRRNRVETP